MSNDFKTEYGIEFEQLPPECQLEITEVTKEIDTGVNSELAQREQFYAQYTGKYDENIRRQGIDMCYKLADLRKTIEIKKILRKYKTKE